MSEIILSILISAMMFSGMDRTEAEKKVMEIQNGNVTQGKIIENSNFETVLNESMPTDKNYMFSPLSIKMALALAVNGADGQTEQEILSILGESDTNSLNEKMENIIAVYENANGFDINIANATFLNTSRNPFDFSAEYKNKLAEIYYAEAKQVNSADAVQVVNGWVKEKTNGKIDSLISNSNFEAILTNAVYFKAEWQNKFPEHRTYKDTFTDRNGNAKTTDFMSDEGNYNYYKDNVVEMIELPYRAGNLDISMYIALSDDKRIDFSQYTNKVERKYGNCIIPKFKTEYSESLKSSLEKMGLLKMFNKDEAEFNKMFENGGTEYYVSDVLHKTFINVDEEGTEAAAVTGIMMATTSLPPEPEFTFKANKPFTYIIKDNTNNEILFMGEYAFVE